MNAIDNPRILVLNADPKKRQAVDKLLEKSGILRESVFTPLDLLQMLLRRDFDVVITDASVPADASRLMGYALTVQPWLQWVAIGPPVAGRAREPVLLKVQPGFRLETPLQAEALRRQVLEAVQVRRQAMRSAMVLPLSRLLFFFEKLRAFLPELSAYHQSFPLTDALKNGIAGILPCRVAGALITRGNFARLKLQVIHPVANSFLRQVEAEVQAGYKLLAGGHAVAPSVTVENEGQLLASHAVNAVGSLCVIPLVTKQQLQGVLVFAAAEPQAYSAAEISHICHVVNHLVRFFPDLAHMQSLAVRDELTGLNNRRSFENEIKQAWQLSRRYRYPLGLLMMDLDKFKKLNDNYGHMIGDLVLKEFARILESVARRTDVLARYGGDEFAVILTNSNAEQTRIFAQRLRDAVVHHVFCKDHYPLQMSVSIGFAGSDHPRVANESDLLSLADRACYLAKEHDGKGEVGSADDLHHVEQLTPMPDQTLPEVTGQLGQIMIIDDDSAICSMFAQILTSAGFKVLTETNPRRALARIREMPDQIDLALIDLKMPEMNGVDVIKAVKAMAPEIVCIVMTGFAAVDSAIAAIRAGAYDFMQKPVDFDGLKFVLKRGVEHRRLRRQVTVCQQQMEDALDERTRSLNETASALEKSYRGTLEALVATLQVREVTSVDHNRRVAEYAVLLARRMNIGEEQIVKIERGALLHDIGKIGIADAILQKVGPLTDAERNVIRQHPAIGYNILKNIPFLQEEAEMIYQHHEHYDGNGYPRGLAGPAINFGARLFAVVDTFDALRSNRVYHKAVTLAAAAAEIKRFAGTQFDPVIVEVFLSSCKEMDDLHVETAAGPVDAISKP